MEADWQEVWHSPQPPVTADLARSRVTNVFHKGTKIYESWEKLLSKKPTRIYYGHAKAAVADAVNLPKAESAPDVELILKYTKKGYDIEKISKKTGAQKSFVEDVVRLYLTHPGVSLQGILDRLDIKGR